MDDLGRDRRGFLAGAAGTGLVLVAGRASAAKRPETKKDAAKEKGGDIPPTEDLMREHGILRRVLLVYDEATRRLAAEDVSAVLVIASAANIVRRFVEGYHEKLEEEFVFPKLEKAAKLAELTKV